jgi:hypothetical protein
MIKQLLFFIEGVYRTRERTWKRLISQYPVVIFKKTSLVLPDPSYTEAKNKSNADGEEEEEEDSDDEEFENDDGVGIKTYYERKLLFEREIERQKVLHSKKFLFYLFVCGIFNLFKG